jgi:hypothetical protein
MANFHTWTNAPKYPVDEDYVWSHKPNEYAEDPLEPITWLWRLDRRLTYEVTMAQWGRALDDFDAFIALGEQSDVVLSAYHQGSDEVKSATYPGDWLVENVQISHPGDKTCVVRVTLVKHNYDKYSWHTRGTA